MKRVRIFGDSHVQTLLHAWKPTLDTNMEIELSWSHGLNWCEFSVEEEGQGLRVRADHVPNMAALDYLVQGPALHVFSSVLHSAPTFRDAVWRRFCPWNCHAHHPELQAVSDQVVTCWVDTVMATRFNLLERIRAKGIPLAVLEPPKPLRRVPELHKVPSDIIVTADRLHRERVRAWLSAHNIPVISTPPETHDGEFTLPEYEAAHPTDPHHGNRSYALAALRQVCAFATGQ